MSCLYLYSEPPAPAMIQDTQVSNGQQRFHANPFKGPNGNILAPNTNLIQLDKHDTQKLDIFGFTINGTPAGTPVSVQDVQFHVTDVFRTLQFIVKCQKCDHLANLAGSVCTVEVAYKSNGTGTGECLIFAGAPGVVVTQRCNSNDQLMVWCFNPWLKVQ